MMNTVQQQPDDLIFALRALYIKDSRCCLNGEFNPLIAGVPLFGQFQFTADAAPRYYEMTGDDGGVIAACAFIVKYEFQYTLTAPVANDFAETDSAATIRADIVVDYLCPRGVKPDDSALQTWAVSAAVNHTWPYWREFSQNTMLRMNLPVMIAPLLDVRHTMVQPQIVIAQEGG